MNRSGMTMILLEEEMDDEETIFLYGCGGGHAGVLHG